MSATYVCIYVRTSVTNVDQMSTTKTWLPRAIAMRHALLLFSCSQREGLRPPPRGQVLAPWCWHLGAGRCWFQRTTGGRFLVGRLVGRLVGLLVGLLRGRRGLGGPLVGPPLVGPQAGRSTLCVQRARWVAALHRWSPPLCTRGPTTLEPSRWCVLLWQTHSLCPVIAGSFGWSALVWVYHGA